MSDHDLFLLAIGSAFGSNLTLLLWFVLDCVSGRRAARRRKAADGRCQDHENCDTCDILDPCPCCGLRFTEGEYYYPNGRVYRLGQGPHRSQA